jgi:hypothetical protein
MQQGANYDFYENKSSTHKMVHTYLERFILNYTL